MPNSETQAVERLSKCNMNLRDSIKELEVLMTRDTGELLNKPMLVEARKNVTKMDLDNCQTQLENVLEIIEEFVVVCKLERKRQEANTQLKRIKTKGETKNKES